MRGIRLAALDRLTWVVVAAVALLTVAALGSLLATRMTAQRPNLSTPEGVVTAFIQAIQANRADEAWSYVLASGTTTGPGSPYPPVPTKEEFRNEVDNSTPPTRARVRILSVAPAGDNATVQLEVTTFSGAPLGTAFSRTVAVMLISHGATWLITSNPSPWQFR
jgi:hypothetical protein